MNKTILNILAALVFAAAPLMAVPSGINYQGALTDDQGNPVTGTRTMSIKLYGAATGGTLLYSEDIGTVDVSDGVFSFEFGTSGTSNAEQSDTVAITDGTATTFQKVLSASEVVAGSVSVSDGTYTWSQSGGSSNEDEFGVAYSTSLRRVSVTYFNGAPAAGRTITATYRTPASGISGALAGDNQPWAEITVDGVAQVPRQKILSVPFAAVAANGDFIRRFGARSTVAANQILRASEDSILTAIAFTQIASMMVKVGKTSPPTTVRGMQSSWDATTTTVSVPIMAGEFFTIQFEFPPNNGNSQGGFIQDAYLVPLTKQTVQ
jgi:hypothetical protein